jgi:hypothetical protein
MYVLLQANPRIALLRSPQLDADSSHLLVPSLVTRGTGMVGRR